MTAPDRLPLVDLSSEGLEIEGIDWQDRVMRMLADLSEAEQADLFAVPLGDGSEVPLPAAKVLARAQTDWFPRFLAHGIWLASFQPVINLPSGAVVGREALIRGRLGPTEWGGSELLAAAEAHDAIYSFDRRALAVSLQTGLTVLSPGEVLFVNVDPRAVVDTESSLNATWPMIGRAQSSSNAVCLEFSHAESARDLDLLADLATAHRARGAMISLDNLSGSPQALACLEVVKPDIAKLDKTLVATTFEDRARHRLTSALIECVHDAGAKVVATGIENLHQCDIARELGADYGQGFYLGRPTTMPIQVDAGLLRHGLMSPRA